MNWKSKQAKYIHGNRAPHIQYEIRTKTLWKYQVEVLTKKNIIAEIKKKKMIDK
jgi:hypothetical protein